MARYRSCWFQQQIKSWDGGPQTWYNWNSYSAWLEQEIKRQVISWGPNMRYESILEIPLNRLTDQQLHDFILHVVLERPSIIGLPYGHIHCFREVRLTTRNGRIVISCPDAIFIYPDPKIYLVEIKSNADEEGLREQLCRARDYFLKRFKIECIGIGVYLEDGILHRFFYPCRWVLT